jgi:hypothetical protein
MKWKFPKWITTLIASIAGIVAITTFIINKPFIAQKKLDIGFYIDKIVLLSNKSDSLTIKYNDKTVANVWKVRIIANNDGKNSIVGIGSHSDINNDTIYFQLIGNFKIISHNIVKNEINGTLLLHNDCFSYSFNKWNSYEKLEIDVLIVNEMNDKQQPSFKVNERDIVNANIKLKTIDLTSDNYYESNFDWLIKVKQVIPSWLLKIIKWFSIILFGCVSIFMIPIWIFSAIDEMIKYKKWEKEYFSTYLEELNNLEIEGNEKNKLRNEPFSVPPALYDSFTIPLPKKPDGIFFTIIVCVMGFICIVLPFGLCALFAYFNL